MSTLLYFMLCLTAPAQDSIKTTIGMERPEHHFYQVEMVFPKANQVSREIHMAVWTPGSYKVRDFARNVERFEAFDLNDNPLTWTKKDKSTWVINVPDGGAFKINYHVFAYEFTVRTSYLDSFYGFINPASVFFYEEQYIDMPYEIQVTPAEGWSSDSPLAKRGSNVFLADNFEELVDSPMIFGSFSRHNFDVNGVPHFWLIQGDQNMRVDEMIDAMKRIGEVTGDLFGAYPFANYYYLSAFRLDGAGGGLEHRNSTMVHGTSDVFRDKRGWDRYLGLLIHEYFHAWNVKAIRDKTLGPFNYQTENYTDLLWMHEGWTSYYDTALMVRADFWEDKELLAEYARWVDSYNKRPGVKLQSLKDSSWNSWIHQYQPSRTSGNSRISYYSGGAMSGLALDLTIRYKTGNGRSLDDVMRLLYNEYAARGRSVDYNIVMAAVSLVMGEDARDWFDTYIAKPTPFDWETLLSYAGLEMVYKTGEEKGEEGEAPKAKPYQPNPKVDMGIRTSSSGGGIIIRDVHRGGAGWEAGLDFDDEILAINGRRVNSGNFSKILGWSRPGDEVKVLVARAGKVLELPVKLRADQGKLTLKRNENASDLEKAIYAAMFDPNGKADADPKKDADESGDDDGEN